MACASGREPYVDPKTINDAESGGMGRVSGNWINDDVEYALDWPQWETNIPKAKELCLFAVGAAKKWPLRGSLKLTVEIL